MKEMKTWDSFWFGDIHPVDLGRWIRKVRKKRGYRLEDLADGDLSTATISNIERGVPRVRSEKIACLLKKLGLDKKEWFEGKTKGKRSGMKAVIFAAENLLKAGYPAEALMELEGYSGNKENDILKLRYDLIKGNALKQLGKLSEAEGYFHAAIRGYHETFLSPGGNEEAEAFCSLGELYGERQDWGQALLFTESGLDSYDPAKGNLRLFWTLRRNQARFLWKTGRAWEALNALQKEWKDIEELPYLDEVLIFYRLRARLHLVLGEFDHAFRFAWDGLHKAVAESQMIRIYELARTLAEGCIRLQKWDRAEGCIRLLFRLQQEEVPPDEQVKGCILTGKYYTFHGEHEKAATAFDQAVCSAQESQKPLLLVLAHTAWGDCLYSKKEEEKAIFHYQEALKSVQEIGDLRWERRIYLGLASCWKDKNEQEFFRCMRRIYKIEETLQQEVVPVSRQPVSVLGG